LFSASLTADTRSPSPGCIAFSRLLFPTPDQPGQRREAAVPLMPMRCENPPAARHTSRRRGVI
jgi:hypothetical protein